MLGDEQFVSGNASSGGANPDPAQAVLADGDATRGEQELHQPDEAGAPADGSEGQTPHLTSISASDGAEQIDAAIAAERVAAGMNLDEVLGIGTIAGPAGRSNPADQGNQNLEAGRPAAAQASQGNQDLEAGRPELPQANSAELAASAQVRQRSCFHLPRIPRRAWRIEAIVSSMLAISLIYLWRYFYNLSEQGGIYYHTRKAYEHDGDICAVFAGASLVMALIGAKKGYWDQEMLNYVNAGPDESTALLSEMHGNIQQRAGEGNMGRAVEGEVPAAGGVPPQRAEEGFVDVEQGALPQGRRGASRQNGYIERGGRAERGQRGRGQYGSARGDGIRRPPVLNSAESEDSGSRGGRARTQQRGARRGRAGHAGGSRTAVASDNGGIDAALIVDGTLGLQRIFPDVSPAGAAFRNREVSSAEAVVATCTTTGAFTVVSTYPKEAEAIARQHGGVVVTKANGQRVLVIPTANLPLSMRAAGQIDFSVLQHEASAGSADAGTQYDPVKLAALVAALESDDDVITLDVSKVTAALKNLILAAGITPTDAGEYHLTKVQLASLGYKFGGDALEKAFYEKDDHGDIEWLYLPTQTGVSYATAQHGWITGDAAIEGVAGVEYVRLQAALVLKSDGQPGTEEVINQLPPDSWSLTRPEAAPAPKTTAIVLAGCCRAGEYFRLPTESLDEAIISALRRMGAVEVAAADSSKFLLVNQSSLPGATLDDANLKITLPTASGPGPAAGSAALSFGHVQLCKALTAVNPGDKFFLIATKLTATAINLLKLAGVAPAKRADVDYYELTNGLMKITVLGKEIPLTECILDGNSVKVPSARFEKTERSELLNRDLDGVNLSKDWIVIDLGNDSLNRGALAKPMPAPTRGPAPESEPDAYVAVFRAPVIGARPTSLPKTGDKWLKARYSVCRKLPQESDTKFYDMPVSKIISDNPKLALELLGNSRNQMLIQRNNIFYVRANSAEVTRVGSFVFWDYEGKQERMSSYQSKIRVLNCIKSNTMEDNDDASVIFLEEGRVWDVLRLRNTEEAKSLPELPKLTIGDKHFVGIDRKYISSEAFGKLSSSATPGAEAGADRPEGDTIARPPSPARDGMFGGVPVPPVRPVPPPAAPLPGATSTAGT